MGRWLQRGPLPLSVLLAPITAAMPTFACLFTVHTRALTHFVTSFCSYNYVGPSHHADEDTEAGSARDKGLGSEWEVRAPAVVLGLSPSASRCVPGAVTDP